MKVKVGDSEGGIGFCGLLTILFIGLKLTHYIDWSWVWVLAPLWIPLSLTLIILVLTLVGSFLVGLYNHLKGGY